MIPHGWNRELALPYFSFVSNLPSATCDRALPNALKLFAERLECDVTFDSFYQKHPFQAWLHVRNVSESGCFNLFFGFVRRITAASSHRLLRWVGYVGGWVLECVLAYMESVLLIKYCGVVRQDDGCRKLARAGNEGGADAGIVTGIVITIPLLSNADTRRTRNCMWHTILKSFYIQKKIVEKL